MDTVTMIALSAFGGDFPSDIYEVGFDRELLRVRVAEEPDGPELIFDDAIGFRYLDEGDLLEYWPEGENNRNGWVFEVQAGGWFDLESNREGFMSADRPGLREFFVASINGCLSVLAFNEPELKATS